MRLGKILIQRSLMLLLAGVLLVTGTSFGQQTTPGDGGKRFIQRFDKDGDGKVSKEEFPGHQGLFSRHDANGDGYIDESEAMAKGSRHGMRGRDFISRFDRDGDGKVSEEEFQGPKGNFSRLDLNGDGYIDQSENPKAPAQRAPRETMSN